MSACVSTSKMRLSLEYIKVRQVPFSGNGCIERLHRSMGNLEPVAEMRAIFKNESLVWFLGPSGEACGKFGEAQELN